MARRTPAPIHLSEGHNLDLRIEQLQRRAAAHPGVIPLAGGLPADELLPRSELGRAMESILAHRTHERLHTEGGRARRNWPDSVVKLRGWIADRLNARGATVDDDDVIVTAGAQHALGLVARCLPPGRSIAVGDETYPGALAAFAAAQHDVLADGGPQRATASGVNGLGREAADTHFVTDGVSCPRGVDAVSARRDELLAGDAQLVVDEACVELRFDGKVPRPLCADAPDRVWHIGSFSKTVCPGLGVGWLIPPRHASAAVMARIRHEVQHGSLVQAALVELLEREDHDVRLERARNLYAARADRAIAALRRYLPSWRITEPEGGLGLWVETDLDGADDVEVMATAIANGVSIDPGCMFRPDGQGQPTAFRISYAHAPLAELDEGIRRLARATRSFRRSDRDHAA